MTDEQVALYHPTLIKETPFNLDKQTVAYNQKLYNELKNGNGLIKVKLNEDVVIQRISHDLYANVASGFRELLNNEVRACHTAKEHNPEIHVTLNPIERKLTIEGINSLGIDSDTFLAAMRVLGNSTNFNGSEIGQFGFGFASYTTLSDTVILETFSRNSNERFAVCGKSGIGFDILPEPTTLSTYGTRITVILRDNVKMEEFIKSIHSMCMFKDVPIFFTLTHDYKEDHYSQSFPQGTSLISQKDPKQNLIDLMNQKAQSAWEMVEIDNDDFLFIGMVHTKTDYLSFYDYHYMIIHDAKLLCHTPIEAKIDIPKIFCAYYLNIKNERKYPPTPDRERLSETTISTLQTTLDNAIKEELDRLYPEPLSRSTATRYNGLLHAIIGEPSYYRRRNYDADIHAHEPCTFQSNRLTDILITLGGSYTYVGNDKTVSGCLGSILSNHYNVMFCLKHKPKAIREARPTINCAVITSPIDNRLCSMLNIEELTLASTSKKANSVCHTAHVAITGWGYNEDIKDCMTETTEEDHTLCVKNIKPFLAINRQFIHSWGISSTIGIALKDFIAEHENMTINTNIEGLTTLKQLATKNPTIIISKYSETAKLLRTHKDCFVVCDADTAFIIAAYFVNLGKPYSIFNSEGCSNIVKERMHLCCSERISVERKEHLIAIRVYTYLKYNTETARMFRDLVDSNCEQLENILEITEKCPFLYAETPS